MTLLNLSVEKIFGFRPRKIDFHPIAWVELKFRLQIRIQHKISSTDMY